MLSRFFQWNRQISDRIGANLPTYKEHLFFHYPKMVGEKILLEKPKVILEVGAGKNCFFAQYLSSENKVRLIGIDISANEMKDNAVLNEQVVADVCQKIPLPDNSVDVIISRSALEHFSDQQKFFEESFRVLKPGGWSIHFLANKFSPHSLFNQALPHSISNKLLKLFFKESEEECGFYAHYNKCWPKALEKLSKETGFREIKIYPSYHQSFYYGFFIPFYLLSSLYELTIRALNLRNLSAHLVVFGRK